MRPTSGRKGEGREGRGGKRERGEDDGHVKRLSTGRCAWCAGSQVARNRKRERKQNLRGLQVTRLSFSVVVVVVVHRCRYKDVAENGK